MKYDFLNDLGDVRVKRNAFYKEYDTLDEKGLIKKTGPILGSGSLNIIKKGDFSSLLRIDDDLNKKMLIVEMPAETTQEEQRKWLRDTKIAYKAIDDKFIKGCFDERDEWIRKLYKKKLLAAKELRVASRNKKNKPHYPNKYTILENISLEIEGKQFGILTVKMLSAKQIEKIVYSLNR